jgi:dihydrofolate reductase
MRKIIVQEYVTIDGFIEDPKDQEMKWVTNHFNEEIAKEIAEWADNTDTILIGRKTYEIFSSYWPSEAAKKTDPIMFNHMNNSQKIVFSKTIKDVQWNNSKLVRDIDAGEIKKLKQKPGKDITVSGSASIVQALANLNLIDKYYLMIFPLAIGNGKPLFNNLKEKVNLSLIEHKTLNNGVIVLLYEAVS